MTNFNKPFTVIESPFSAPTMEELVLNVQYAILAVRDSLNRGEAPYASHLFYTQMLNDNNKTERQLGIDAGLTICQNADQTAVYTDLGISEGMKYGIKTAKKAGRGVVERSLYAGVKTPKDIKAHIRQEYAKYDLPSANTIEAIYGRIIK